MNATSNVSRIPFNLRQWVRPQKSNAFEEVAENHANDHVDDDDAWAEDHHKDKNLNNGNDSVHVTWPHSSNEDIKDTLRERQFMHDYMYKTEVTTVTTVRIMLYIFHPQRWKVDSVMCVE